MQNATSTTCPPSLSIETPIAEHRASSAATTPSSRLLSTDLLCNLSEFRNPIVDLGCCELDFEKLSSDLNSTRKRISKIVIVF
jgi:hypothetical protein